MSYFADSYWLEQLDEQCREHNREVDGLHERIADLEAENERLRRAGYEIGYHDGAKRIADLEQLVVDFYAYTFGGGDACKRCSYGSDCGAGNPCKFDEHVERRMKALGMEVDA